MPDGRPRTNTSSYTELGSGMHRWDSRAGAWVDAEAVIEIAGNTAVAGKGAHQVTFAANANTAGCIDLLTPDGKRLRSHLLGIAWYDAANGRTELIGELKDSLGELHHPNVVIYPDAFDGLKADLRYTYGLGSFEQDVILREQPVLPAGYAPDTTRLEVWTEFIEHPGAALSQRGKAGQTDDTLDFGTMQTTEGRAFSIGNEPDTGRSVGVAKRWFVAEGRSFLVEAVRYQAARRELEKLPAQGQAQAGPRRLWPAHPAGRPFPEAPAPRQARANQPAEKFRMASTPSPLDAPRPSDGRGIKGEGGNQAGVRGAAADLQSPFRKSEIVNHKSPPGFVLDYTLYASLTNFTFQGDTTYYASNTVNFYGTTTFEGGTVVKFAKTNTAQLNLNSTVTWLTAQYRPAIFTAKDDNTVGETIAGSTGAPSGYYGGTYLSYGYGSITNENLRISYARTAIQCQAYQLGVRHAQFISCSNVFDTATYGTGAYITFENVLLFGISHVHVVNGQPRYFTGTHLTIHYCDAFVTSAGGMDWAPILNNCVISELGSWGTDPPDLDSCYVAEEDEVVFQTVGAAAHYLLPGSNLRNSGVSLSGALADEIKKRTTYPPIVLSNLTINYDLTLSPQAKRDTDTPDLGYHYDPLDFVCGTLNVQDATILLLPGTAVGFFCASQTGNYGIATLGGSTLLSEGTPASLNRLVRYNMVQEQANTNWSGLRGPILHPDWLGTAPPAVQMRFTEWAVPARDAAHIYFYYHPEDFGFRDCQFHGGDLWTISCSFNFTNCLLNRVNFYAEDFDTGYSISAFNNLFLGGAVYLNSTMGGLWSFTNNFFVNVSVSPYGVAADYNAYTTNVVRVSAGAHDVLLATNAIAFDTGPLGYFYLPTNGPATNLFNKGSTSATNVGLYHFTCTANQWKETNSVVDISFHYAAVATNGLPVDTDNDGIPDYLEDANGNGSLDHRETKVNDAADRGLRVFITRPKSGSTIP